MEVAFIVLHLREDVDGYDDVKFIGAYSSQQKALEAVHRLKDLPGFAEYPDGFSIDRYKIDEDHWTTGFFDASKDLDE
jgi:hypothetical protein